MLPVLNLKETEYLDPFYSRPALEPINHLISYFTDEQTHPGA